MDNMEQKIFIGKFASQFEETDANKFHANTKFKDLEEWSSLLALSVIAMTDEQYGVALKGDDIRKATTIEDLYNIMKSKK
jgi:acyl carrier protein